MYCRNCGNEIREDAAFCGKCGSSTANAQAKNLRNKNNKTVIFLLCCLVVFISGVLVFFVNTHISKNNLQEIINLTLEDFCQYITNDSDNKYGKIEEIIASDIVVKVDNIYRKKNRISCYTAECNIETYDVLKVYNDLIANPDEIKNLAVEKVDEFIVERLEKTEKITLDVELDFEKTGGKIVLISTTEFINACYGESFSIIEDYMK